MPRVLRYLILTLLWLWASLATAAVCDWPAWEQYKQHYISEQGRVIDTSTPNKITTSEGQSYAMFFALVANDRAMFDRLLKWTEDNLSAGDLRANLPAWLWGESKDKQWAVLDPNSASDADLWIAYNLLEAGRLWKEARYQTLGTTLLARIAKEEVVNIPGLGVMLLPGKVGFAEKESWRVTFRRSCWPVLLRWVRRGNPCNAPRSACYWKLHRKDFRPIGSSGKKAKAGNLIPPNPISVAMTPFASTCGQG
ncbi:endoglucanase [Pectobacterium atrosepticum]|nr:endoglucanase [Pectobacterium atrosepticum]POW26827.1 endoglucanase [Pectobacterium atrosepticum]